MHYHGVWVIGVIMALGGVMAVLRPDWMRKTMVFFTGRHRFQAAAVVKLLIGVAFLILATGTRIPWVIILIGILTAAGNLWALLIKPETAHNFMLWWQKQPFWVYRLWGIVGVLIAALVIYAGWPRGL